MVPRCSPRYGERVAGGGTPRALAGPRHARGLGRGHAARDEPQADQEARQDAEEEGGDVDHGVGRAARMWSGQSSLELSWSQPHEQVSHDVSSGEGEAWG